MTTQKSFKAKVRSRMGRTGESYTAARRQLLAKVAAATGVQPLDLADDVVRERTGRGWDEWLALLDAWGATEQTHREMARWLRDEHGVDSWWSQSITVTYEQARGLRRPGQMSDGSYTANASRTVAVPFERLYAGFADEGLRRKWLPGAEVVIRSVTEPKGARVARGELVGRPGKLVVSFDPKGEAKATVALSHTKLPDAATAAEMKALWKDGLAALKQLLEEG